MRFGHATSHLRVLPPRLLPAPLIQGQMLPEEVASDIEKDVDRTFPEMARSADCISPCFTKDPAQLPESFHILVIPLQLLVHSL